MRQPERSVSAGNVSPVAIHFYPFDAVGGAEMAIRKLSLDTKGEIWPHSLAVSRHPSGPTAFMSHSDARNPLSFKATLDAWHIFRMLKPRIAIFSLWKSVFIFLLVRVFSPTTRTIVFLHCSAPFHFVDRLASGLMHRLADEVWADSEATLHSRLGAKLERSRPTFVMSMILEQREHSLDRTAGPQFISWCRLTPVKRMHLSIRMLNHLRDIPNLRYVAIGPDGGSRSDLEILVHELGLSQHVDFPGSASQDEIVKKAGLATFYVQPSSVEGFAMAVVEAMQLGLIPVVTPVGEIQRFCRDGENAVIFTDPETTAGKIRDLLKDPERMRRMSRAAVAATSDLSTYTDDVSRRVREILGPS